MMFQKVRFAIGPILCVTCLTGVSQEVRSKPKCKVELRWVETKYIEGLTEEEGFQTSCDPKSVMYPHKKPALVLTANEVTEAKVIHHDYSRNGLSPNNYQVTMHLTKEAREKLAASCDGNEMRLLTVVVDDKYWGIRRYEKDTNKPFVPDQARAETFSPDVGYFSSQYEAERLTNTFK